MFLPLLGLLPLLTTKVTQGRPPQAQAPLTPWSSTLSWRPPILQGFLPHQVDACFLSVINTEYAREWVDTSFAQFRWPERHASLQVSSQHGSVISPDRAMWKPAQVPSRHHQDRQQLFLFFFFYFLFWHWQCFFRLNWNANEQTAVGDSRVQLEPQRYANVHCRAEQVDWTSVAAFPQSSCRWHTFHWCHPVLHPPPQPSPPPSPLESTQENMSTSGS